MRPKLGFYLVFLGVLLCGCTRQSSGAARSVASARPEPAKLPARVGTHVPSTTGTERLTYTVHVDAALERLDVELCPEGFRIERLNAPSPGAQALLSGGRIVTPEGDVAFANEANETDGVDLPATRPDECVRWGVQLPEKAADPTSFRRVEGDRLLSPDLWLWVPTPRPEGVRIGVKLDLPEGVRGVLPWAFEAGTGTGTEERVPETAFAWKSAGALTRGVGERVAVVGGELQLSVLGPGFEHATEVREWVAQGARSASALFGHFPLPRAGVILVPSERSGPAFGMALRGGGPLVTVFLDRHASAATLADDWTCAHEFLHLAVPRLPTEDSWLFEGLATYYTEVTRARAGVISSEQAYQHLLDGFERGRRAGGTLTLRNESAQMRERHSFHRVYWAGAALALLVDVASRRGGGKTLDDALRSFAGCCAASEEDWTAARVLAQLDTTLGAPLFTAQAQRWLDRSEFPALGQALRALGVTSGKHGRAVFGRGPDAALRDAIMAPTALQ